MITPEYSDSTRLCFGKHIGKTLNEIRLNDPAYLEYLWNDSKEGATMYDAKLAKYIKDNLSRIKMEALAKKQQRYAKRKWEAK